MKKTVRNKWEMERNSLNHTYVKHYFDALIVREEFETLCSEGKFDDEQITSVITNFHNIEKKTKSLLAWAVPFASSHQEVAMLSQLHGTKIDSSLEEIYATKVEEYTIKCKKSIAIHTQSVENKLETLKNHIERLKKQDSSIDKAFVDDLRKSTEAFSAALKNMKSISCTSEKQRQPIVLVIDDHYAAESGSGDANYYDRNYFLKDYSSNRFTYQFCTAFDTKEHTYSVEAVKHFMESLDVLPDVILLDVMFGDEEYLGVEILSWLFVEYKSIPTVMMTSKEKSELLFETIKKGAVDYLVKPFYKKELHQTIMRYTLKNSLLLGQEDHFLANVQEVISSSSNILIHTNDTLRAKYLIAYYAHIKDMAFGTIDLSTTLLTSDMLEDNSVYLLENIEHVSLEVQKKATQVIKQLHSSISVCAVCSPAVVQKLKHHEFDTELYNALAQTNIVLEAIPAQSLDMLILFRYLFELHKPTKIKIDFYITDVLCRKVFSNKEAYTADEINLFIMELFAQQKQITKSILIEFANRYFSKEDSYSYEDLQERLVELKCEEFDILLIALSKTTEGQKKPNKTQAIAGLLQKEKVSTNEYDRWIKKIWKELPLYKQKEYRNSGKLEALGIKV